MHLRFTRLSPRVVATARPSSTATTTTTTCRRFYSKPLSVATATAAADTNSASAATSASAASAASGAGLQQSSESMRVSRKQLGSTVADLSTLDPRFVTALKTEFPTAIEVHTFLDATTAQLNEEGFFRENTICAVSTCRDENCKPLINAVEDRWDPGFSFTAMSSMLFPGYTAFRAFLSHAPNGEEREKFLLVAMTHIGISDDGEIGMATRPNRNDKTTSCGALCALHKQLEDGKLDLDFNVYDMEYSLLKSHLIGNKIRFGFVPTLKKLTGLAQELVEDDLEKIIKKLIDTKNRDYAVVTGILINGPNMSSWVEPSKLYCVVQGQRRAISLPTAHVDCVANKANENNDNK